MGACPSVKSQLNLVAKFAEASSSLVKMIGILVKEIMRKDVKNHNDRQGSSKNHRNYSCTDSN